MVEKEKQARKLREERLEWREKGTKRDKEQKSRRGARRESNNGEKMYGQHVVINKRSSSA